MLNVTVIKKNKSEKLDLSVLIVKYDCFSILLFILYCINFIQDLPVSVRCLLQIIILYTVFHFFFLFSYFIPLKDIY